ncbi:MAG: hypothetical protein FWG50_03315 [Kiritimatiellaeota bacterium]|nr:hypothetical protein [Kiritimatiellota bacterium]
MSREKWSRDEAIVAFNLYCKLSFKVKESHPEVIDLAKLIGRTPGAVKRKILNFLSLDTKLQAGGVLGFEHIAKIDSQIWDEFNENRAKLADESERLLRRFKKGK